MGLVTEYPFGLVVFCILLGAGYAAWLYYRDLRHGHRGALLHSMIALRFLAVTVISFLLLSPLIRLTVKLVEKPVIIVGIDQSESIVQLPDSGFYRKEFPAMVDRLVTELKKKGDVRLYSFGEKVQSGFTGEFREKKTDISAFFSEINTRYANRNVAALILASDGIYNQGADPYYAARAIQVPIYTVALGDTTLKKDLLIKKVTVNRIAYKGDRFPVEVLLELNKCEGLKTRLSLIKGDTELDSREIRISSGQSVQRIVFYIDARQTGMARYRLQLDPVDGETSVGNNRSEFLVEVLDARRKVALIGNAPHPDMTTIRQALENTSHFEVTVFTPENFLSEPENFDLIILHQLPSISNVRDLTPIMKARGAVLFFLGTQTDINAFNSLKTGLVINSSKNSFYEAEPVLNKDFSFFIINSQDQVILDEFPPLLSPFGSYQTSPLSEVLVFQQIAGVSTKTPLVMFSRAGEKKIGIVAGENIWRWRLSNFLQQSNHDIFDRTLDKIAVYLATQDDKSFFRIHVKTNYAENEPVELEAELFNRSYERITDPDVNITITDGDNKNYPFVFSRGTSSYYLKAGQFPVGTYRYDASVKFGNELYRKTGEFHVNEINIESTELMADHRLLSRIALAHDGMMTGPGNMSEIAGKIMARNDIASVSSDQIRITDLISSPWLFILIITLLTAEWILRKREGK